MKAKTRFTKTVAVTPETHRFAKAISENTGIKLGNVIERAIMDYALKVKKN